MMRKSLIFLAFALVGVSIFFFLKPAKAACGQAATNFGSATQTLNVPTAATYYIWSRVKSTSSSASYWLELDGGTCYKVGGTGVPASFGWVNYQNGNTGQRISTSLAQGSHTLKYIGLSSGFGLDKVIATSDAACTPLANGDNCLVGGTPVTPPPTPPPAPPPSGTPDAGGGTMPIGTGNQPTSGTITLPQAPAGYKSVIKIGGNTVSGQLDTTTLDNGTYQIEVTTTAPDGTKQLTHETIVINNKLNLFERIRNQLFKPWAGQSGRKLNIAFIIICGILAALVFGLTRASMRRHLGRLYLKAKEAATKKPSKQAHAQSEIQPTIIYPDTSTGHLAKPKSLSPQSLAIITSIVLVGFVTLVLTRAAGKPVAVEPESGTIVAPATATSDPTSSGGSYLGFQTQLPPAAVVTPDTYVLNGPKMASVKKVLSDPTFYKPYLSLLINADRHLGDQPLSVVTKSQTPPSGDKHDFLSLAPYFWPDPSKPDGLPYISRDGQSNPEFYAIPDHANFVTLVSTVEILSQAYYFSGQTKYSDKAEQMINTWFIAGATKMNPNLNYTGIRKGTNDGDPTGIIELASLGQIIDDVKLLQTSPSWTAADQSSFSAWCSSYLNWLQTSSNGISEAKSPQNHATWYRVQQASLAEFLGNHGLAQQAASAGKALINGQIKADGTQPLEMARTRPWSYSAFNLEGLTALAQIGGREQVDLWGYSNPSGGSIRRAVDFLAPYAVGNLTWNYSDLLKFKPDLLTVSLRQAATAYNQPVYSGDADKSQGTSSPNDWTRLTY